MSRPGAERRVFLIGVAISAVALAVATMVALLVANRSAAPVAVVALVLIAILAVMVLVGREEYRVARGQGLTVGRAIARALKKTIDAFVMGD